MNIELPQNAEALTADWFQAVLDAQQIEASIAQVSLGQIGEGAGMMSQLYRAELGYGAGQGPASLVVKLATDNQQNRDVAAQFDNYRREVQFYQRAAHLTPMRTARCYLARADTDKDFVLVLEDFSDWQQGDQVQGCSLPRAHAVMHALADLHGHFWEQVDGDDMQWLLNSHPSVMSEGLAAGTEANYDNFVLLFKDVLSPDLKNSKARYLQGLPALQSWMNDSPRTVVHGDYRMDNLFFLPDGDQIEVACCDWQAPVRGKGIQDVAYFLTGSVETDVRREHESALLNEWVTALHARGVQDYTYDQAFNDYRRATLAMWTYAVIIGGGLAAETARADNWVSAMVRRVATAMVDLDCLELL